ncbi:hypothetical protein ACFL5V_01270 [Fibrobacterota bacterium]
MTIGNRKHIAAAKALLIPGLIWELSFSTPALVSELKEILNESLSEGLISYSQYQYTINELQEEPNCDEIKDLTGLTGISTPEIRDLLKSHCDIPGKDPSAGKRPFFLKTVKFKTSAYHNIYPKKAGNEPVFVKTTVLAPSFNGYAEFNSEAVKVGKRQFSYEFKDLKIIAGNLTAASNLRFVTGRNFWLDQHSLSDSTGLMFTSRNLLNGFQILHRGKHHFFQGSGTWNKNVSGSDTLDAVTYGILSGLTTDWTDVTLQVNLSRFEFYLRENELNLVNGVMMKEKVLNLFQVGIAHSWNSGMDANGSSLVGSSLYGESIILLPDGKSWVKLFQAGNNWTNPLMDYSARTTDTTPGGIRRKGRGEGGFHMVSSLPLLSHEPGPGPLTGSLETSLDLSTVLHWTALDTQVNYRRLTLSLNTCWDYLSHKAGLYSTATDSSRFITMKNLLGGQPGNYLLFLGYAHKSGHYRGTYPRVLELQTGLNLPGQYRIKVKVQTRDIVNFREYIDLLFLQTWTLSGKIKLDWSLKIPWHEGDLSRDLYYRGKLQANF